MTSIEQRMSNPSFRRRFVYAALEAHRDALRIEQRYNPNERVDAELADVERALADARRAIDEEDDERAETANQSTRGRQTHRRFAHDA